MGHTLFTFLENRGVLHVPNEIEARHHCIMSVLELCQYLTGVFAADGGADELGKRLRAIRSVRRRFLTPVGHDDPVDQCWFPEPRGGVPELLDWPPNQDSGELHCVFSVHIPQIVAKYEVDVGDGPTSILSLSAEDEQWSWLIAAPSSSKLPHLTRTELVRRRCGSAICCQSRNPDLLTGATEALSQFPLVSSILS